MWFKVGRILAGHAWRWTVVLLVASAIVLSAARLLLPELEHYRQDVEKEVSALVGQPVTIARFDVGWHGLGPRLYLREVRVHARDGDRLLFGFDQAHVNIDLWTTLISGQPSFGALTLSGLDLSLVRDGEGRISLEGLQRPEAEKQKDDTTSAKAESESSEAADWLWRQGQLAVENSTIRWRDMKASGRQWVVNDVNLYLTNQDKHHRLAGRMRLPDAVGRELTAVVDFERNGDKLADWNARFFLDGEDIQFANWLARYEELGLPLRRGEGDLRLWGEWRNHGMHGLRGEVTVRDLDFPSDGTEAGATETVNYLFSRFAWDGVGDHWHLDLDRLSLARGGRMWPPARLQATYIHDGEQRSLVVGTDFARVEDLLALAKASRQMPEKTRSILSELQPRGDMHDTYFSFSQEGKEEPAMFLRSRVENLALAPWHKMPGLEGIDGTLNLDPRSGVIDLTTHDALIDTSGLFRKPLPIGVMDGRIAWARLDDGMHIDLRRLAIVNDDIRSRVGGTIFLPADGSSPFASLAAEFGEGKIGSTGRYLPTRVMPETTVHWLDTALVSGRVGEGAAILHGPLRHFPFDDGSGRFEIRFNIHDGILEHNEGWPRIEQIEAEAAFVGRRMEIRGHSAKILDTDLQEVDVAIPDLHGKPAVLTINGKAEGPTMDGVRYLTQSPPLHEHFGLLMDGAEATGRSHLQLALNIPLAKGAHTGIDGRVSFEQSGIDFKRQGVDIAATDGEMAFTEKGITAKGLKGEIMGQPAEVDIETRAKGPEAGITFRGHGTSQYKALAQRLPYIIGLDHLKGTGTWKAVFNIPPRGASDSDSVLRVDADLKGTAVTLPSPLAKKAKDKGQLSLMAELGPKRAQWRFNYDDARLAGIFEVKPDKDRMALRRGELRFGAKASLPPDPGIRVAGQLGDVSEPEWAPIIFADRGTAPAAESGVGVNQLLLGAKRFHYLDHDFHDVDVRGSKAGGIWTLEVSSRELGGVLNVPEEKSLPLDLDLDHLELPRFEEAATKKEAKGTVSTVNPDPLALPPINLRAKRFSYGGTGFGALELVTEQRVNGLSVEKLKLRGDKVNVDASGAWNRIGGRHTSVLSGSLDIKNLGELLAGLGYVATVDKGKGSASFDLRWSAPLPEPQAALLNGSVMLDVRDGSLLEVDPGAGRLFGLLSIQALPRRLTLDFRDFFGKGFGFDSMKGRFDIKSGDAVTRDFTLKGPAAKIEMAGRIGLAARDYDQHVTVTPHVTSGLPLVGVVAGGLGVGAAVLLAEQILKPKIDKATRIQYTINGGWDDPKITRVDEKTESKGKEDKVLPEVLREP